MIRTGFGLLLSLVALPCTAQVSSDPLAGDTRLSTPRTLKFREVPMRDFLASVTQSSGVQFFAEPSVQGDRITLFAHDKPLAASLKAAAGLFGYSWKKSGTGPKTAYTLFQSPAAKAAEDETLNKQIRATAEAIAEEVSLFHQLSKMSAEQLSNREEELDKELPLARDAKRARAIRQELGLIGLADKPSEYERYTYRLLATLTVDQIAAMLRAGSTEFSYPPNAPAKEYPKALIDEVAAQLTVINGSAGGRNEIGFLSVRFSGSISPSLSLRWTIATRKKSSFSTYTSTTTRVSPMVPLPLVYESIDGEGLPESQFKGQTVSFDAEPVVQTAGSAMRRTELTVGEALERLDQFAPIDVVCDALYSSRFEGMKAKDMPVREALIGLAQRATHSIALKDGFVHLRSRNFSADRWAEPPALQTIRWSQRATEGSLELDDYAEVAMLPEQQFTTLMSSYNRGIIQIPMLQVQQAKPALAFWSALSRPHRREMTSSALEIAKLPAESITSLKRALFDQPGLAQGAGAKSMDDLFAKGKLRLEVRDTTYFGVKRPGQPPSVIALSNMDEAVSYFQQLDNKIRPSEIKEVTQTYYSFLIEYDGGRMSFGYLSLNPRWRD